MTNIISIKDIEDRITLITNRLESATPGPWKCYRASEFPLDWRIAVAGVIPVGQPDTVRGYIGRLTASHGPQSGNAGCATDPPEEADVQLMAHAPEDIRFLLALTKALQEKIVMLKVQLDEAT